MVTYKSGATSARCYQLKQAAWSGQMLLAVSPSQLVEVRVRSVTVEIWWHHTEGQRDARKREEGRDLFLAHVHI